MPKGVNLISVPISLTSLRSESEDDYWYRVLALCCQTNPSHFGIEFPSWSFQNFEYIDSGTYSHVIKARGKEQNNTELVFKIIKVIQKTTLNSLNALSFNGFELYGDVFQEIVIIKQLSNLHKITCDYRGYEYLTHSFPKVFKSKIVHGEIPNYFLIRKYNETISKAKPVERFDDLFGVPREHLVLMMKFCGDSIWNLINYRLPHVPKNARTKYGVTSDQLLSVCYQVTLALTVSEALLEFEHRDMHVCNILVKPTKKDYVTFILHSTHYRVKSFHMKACIIDATFSRIRVGEEVYYLSLSNRLKTTDTNPNPDAQEVVYQQMYRRIGDEWRDWFPETNIYWLKYFYKEVLISDAFTVDCNDHTKKILSNLIENITNYKSLIDFVQDMFLQNDEKSPSKIASQSKNNKSPSNSRSKYQSHTSSHKNLDSSEFIE